MRMQQIHTEPDECANGYRLTHTFDSDAIDTEETQSGQWSSSHEHHDLGAKEKNQKFRSSKSSEKKQSHVEPICL